MRITRRAFLGTAISMPWLARTTQAARPTLRVSATPSIFKPVFEKLIAAFRERHPGMLIELTATARAQEDQIRNTLRASLIDDLPDVSFEGLNYLRVLQQRRIALPLDERIRLDPLWNEAMYGRSVLESARVGQEVIGLSTAMSVPLIYYNADLLARVTGLKALPREWDEILDLAGRLTTAGKSNVIGGFCQHESSTWIFMSLIESQGGSMMNAAETRTAFDGPEGLRALSIYQAFGRAGQARADMSREQARQAFVSGGIALLVDSSSSLVRMATLIGARFRLGTARIPVAPRGRVPVAGIAATLMCKDAARQADAWQFMKFVCGPEGQTMIGKSTGYLPANDVVIHRRDLLGGYYESRPLVRPIIETLPFASGWYAFPGPNAAKIDAVICDEVGAVVALEKSPGEALARMRASVETLLNLRST